MMLDGIKDYSGVAVYDKQYQLARDNSKVPVYGTSSATIVHLSYRIFYELPMESTGRYDIAWKIADKPKS